MPRKAPVCEPIDFTPPSPAVDADILGDGGLGLDAAAAFCGHKRTWMEEKLAAGEIPSFVLDRRRVVPKRSLIRWLALKMSEASQHDRR